MKGPFVSSATAACLVALLAGPRLATAGAQPAFQWDPDTMLPCIMWEDNANDTDCEEVRDYWNITPEQFTRWNPSVGLDCKPWRFQSYCVVPQERLDNDPRTSLVLESSTSTESAVSSTTSSTISSTDVPLIGTWTARGCYVDEDEELPVLEERIDTNVFQTVDRCQELCSEAAFIYAGNKRGEECWCGSFVGGELTNDTDECDMPCPGYPTETCGGMDRINVYELEVLGGNDENEDVDEKKEEEADEEEEQEKEEQEEELKDEAEEEKGEEEEAKEEEEEEKEEETPTTTPGAVASTESPDSGASRNSIWFF